MAIAEEIDPRFNITHVVFTPDEFMEVLNQGRLKKGAVVIWDEAGVGMSSREWYSISNKAINYVLQTFRRRNLGVIFTVPSFSFIDNQARVLFHHYMETKAIDSIRKVVRIKVFQLQYSSQTGKLYFKFPYIRERHQKVAMFSVHKPSPSLIVAYENKKKEFTDDLNIEIQNNIKSIRLKKTDHKMSFDDMVEKVLEEHDQYVKTYAGRTFIDKNLIMLRYKVAMGVSERIKLAVEKSLNLGKQAKG